MATKQTTPPTWWPVSTSDSSTATDVDARYLRKRGHPARGLLDAIARDKLSSLPRRERAEEWLESAYLPCVTHLVKNTYHQWVEWTLPLFIIAVSLSIGIIIGDRRLDNDVCAPERPDDASPVEARRASTGGYYDWHDNWHIGIVCYYCWTRIEVWLDRMFSSAFGRLGARSDPRLFYILLT